VWVTSLLAVEEAARRGASGSPLECNGIKIMPQVRENARRHAKFQVEEKTYNMVKITTISELQPELDPRVGLILQMGSVGQTTTVTCLGTGEPPFGSPYIFFLLGNTTQTALQETEFAKGGVDGSHFVMVRPVALACVVTLCEARNFIGSI
jgi:hypothetical protein